MWRLTLMWFRSSKLWTNDWLSCQAIMVWWPSQAEGIWSWKRFPLVNHFTSICIAHRLGAWYSSHLVMNWLFTKEKWIMKLEVEATWSQFKTRTQNLRRQHDIIKTIVLEKTTRHQSNEPHPSSKELEEDKSLTMHHLLDKWCSCGYYSVRS